MKIITLFISVIFFGFIACDEKGKIESTIEKLVLGKDKSLEPDFKYASEQLDNTKGLSNSSVNAIFRDSENLLWIGTWDGLNRYDGNTFKVFRPELKNTNSLSHQVILKIDEDHTGQIWILTIHGINSYNKKLDTFQRFYFNRKNKPPLSESEFNMALNTSKKVFCAVKDWGIGYFDGTKFQLLETKKIPKKAVRKMEFTLKSELLILFEDNQLYSLCFKTAKDGKETISKTELISTDIKTFGVLSKQKICTISLTGNTVLHSLITKENVILPQKNIENIIGNIPDV